MTQDFMDEFFFNLKQFMNDFDGLKICQMVHVCESGKLPLKVLTSLKSVYSYDRPLWIPLFMFYFKA